MIQQVEVKIVPHIARPAAGRRRRRKIFFAAGNFADRNGFSRTAYPGAIHKSGPSTLTFADGNVSESAPVQFIAVGGRRHDREENANCRPADHRRFTCRRQTHEVHSKSRPA